MKKLSYTLLALALVLFGGGLQAGAQNYDAQQIIDVAKRQQSNRLADEDLAELQISDQYYDQHTGMVHVYAQQYYKGVPVKAGTMGLHFKESGELAYATNKFIAHLRQKANTAKPALSPKSALAKTLDLLGIPISSINTLPAGKAGEARFAKGEMSLHDIPVRLVYEQGSDGSLELAWETRIYTTDEQHYWVISIDARSGVEIARTDLVVHCTFSAHEAHEHGESCQAKLNALKAEGASIPGAADHLANLDMAGANRYRVYDAPIESPNHGTRSLITTAGDPTASPMGWHDDGLLKYTISRGNNVYAYQDPGPASTGIPSIGGLFPWQTLKFDFSLNLSLPPIAYRDAAITNLFYWNNLIHDVFYHYGFDEAAGNFQWDNMNRGGAGLDAVLAEAQDGSGVDNANFLTLPDGLPGRMQMFLWTTALPDILDGDLDNGVIAHEYGHGISTRLTGGPAATCLGGDEQGGEGWSDFFGLIMTMKPSFVDDGFATGRGIGTYVLNEFPTGLGIRPARYSTLFSVNDYTYGNLNDANISVPHGVGFIWCTMLWEMTANLVEVYGFDADLKHGNGGNNIALNLVTTGLKLQPCSPTFVEQRDAILAADQLLYGGANQCLIWEAFAKRGLGFSASSGTNARGDEIEAFDVPAIPCGPTVQLSANVSPIAEDGAAFDIKLMLANNSSSTISGLQLSDKLPAGTTVLSASDPFAQAGGNITFSNLSVPGNSVKTVELQVALNTNSTASLLFFDDVENEGDAWTIGAGLLINRFAMTTADANSGSTSWFAANPDNFSNQTLTLNQSISVSPGTVLRFAHRFNTEANFDGGVVEYATNGTNWEDMGPLFTSNGYNNQVALADNLLINGPCFGGNSGGFITSAADLSPLAGQDIQVRFRFASDVLTAAEGWYVDDIQLATDPTIVTNEAVLSKANGVELGRVSSEILVVQNNQGLQKPDGPSNNGAYTAPISALQLRLAPNPATTAATVAIQSSEEGEGEIIVRNVQGQAVFQQSQFFNMGSTHLKLDLSQYAPGIYFLQAVQGSQQVTERLVVQ